MQEKTTIGYGPWPLVAAACLYRTVPDDRLFTPAARWRATHGLHMNTSIASIIMHPIDSASRLSPALTYSSGPSTAVRLSRPLSLVAVPTLAPIKCQLKACLLRNAAGRRGPKRKLSYSFSVSNPSARLRLPLPAPPLSPNWGILT